MMGPPTSPVPVLTTVTVPVPLTAAHAQPLTVHCRTWPMAQVAYVTEAPVVASVIRMRFTATPVLLILADVTALFAIVAATDPMPEAVMSPVSVVIPPPPAPVVGSQTKVMEFQAKIRSEEHTSELQ